MSKCQKASRYKAEVTHKFSSVKYSRQKWTDTKIKSSSSVLKERIQRFIMNHKQKALILFKLTYRDNIDECRLSRIL